VRAATSFARTAALRIQLENSALAGDLATFLRRCDCTVTLLGDHLLAVDARALPVDPSIRQAELEVASYLRVWSAINDDTAVRVLTTT